MRQPNDPSKASQRHQTFHSDWLDKIVSRPEVSEASAGFLIDQDRASLAASKFVTGEPYVSPPKPWGQISILSGRPIQCSRACPSSFSQIGLPFITQPSDSMSKRKRKHVRPASFVPVRYIALYRPQATYRTPALGREKSLSCQILSDRAVLEQYALREAT